MTTRVDQLIWQPSPAGIEQASLTPYMRWLRDKRGLDFADYDALWQWSVAQIEDFWQSIWEYFEIQSSEPYGRVLTTRDMPGAEWFPGARLNWAEHILRSGEDDDPAIFYSSECNSELGEMTWAELRELSARIATGLRRLGVGPGDRVAAVRSKSLPPQR